MASNTKLSRIEFWFEKRTGCGRTVSTAVPVGAGLVDTGDMEVWDGEVTMTAGEEA